MLKKKLLGLTLAALFLGLGAYLWYDSGSIFGLSQVGVAGPPILVDNHLYLLTGQSRLTYTGSSRFRSSNSKLFIDFWAFDISTLKPIYRRRLQTLPNGNLLGTAVLGAHNQTIWIILATGLHAINRDTGLVTADPERIMYLNPNLRGILPTNAMNFALDSNGLRVRANDGRTWNFHPDSLIATETLPALNTKAIPPAYFLYDALSGYTARGIELGTKWLGLLSKQEATDFEGKSGLYSRYLDYVSRRSLYSGDITRLSSLFQENHTGNFKSLTADFLAPGLLADHRPTRGNVVIFQRNPDSVFVIHKDRLGEEGNLFLARVSGPAGQILWNIPLKISTLQAILPGDQALVIMGKLKENQFIISLDWKTGATQYYDQSDTESHPKPTPAP